MKARPVYTFQEDLQKRLKDPEFKKLTIIEAKINDAWMDLIDNLSKKETTIEFK